MTRLTRDDNSTAKHLVFLFEDDQQAEEMVENLGAPLECLDEYEGLTAFVMNIKFVIEVDPRSHMWGLFCSAPRDKGLQVLRQVFPDIEIIRCMALADDLFNGREIPFPTQHPAG